jgi:hypothetical protein
MIVTLKKMFRHGGDPSITVILLSVEYGWSNIQYRETFKIICDRGKNRVSVSVRIMNPGIGHIIERISEILSHHIDEGRIPDPVTIAEHLAEDFEFDIDADMLRKKLAE